MWMSLAEDVSELLFGSIFTGQVKCNYIFLTWPVKTGPTKRSEMSSAKLNHAPYEKPKLRKFNQITVKVFEA